MAEDPYYWHYRCPASGNALTRVDLFGAVPEDKAVEIMKGDVPLPKFPCQFCQQEHEGYLERSKFGRQ
jgi:hypothetical protein